MTDKVHTKVSEVLSRLQCLTEYKFITGQLQKLALVQLSQMNKFIKALYSLINDYRTARALSLGKNTISSNFCHSSSN